VEADAPFVLRIDAGDDRGLAQPRGDRPERFDRCLADALAPVSLAYQQRMLDGKALSQPRPEIAEGGDACDRASRLGDEHPIAERLPALEPLTPVVQRQRAVEGDSRRGSETPFVMSRT
jgi:hypothetical protein